jgi:hypothetical protein
LKAFDDKNRKFQCCGSGSGSMFDEKKIEFPMLWIRDILVRIRIPVPLTNGYGSGSTTLYSLQYTLTKLRRRKLSFQPQFLHRQYEETVGEPGEVIISSLYKEGEGGQVFVLPATEGEQQQQQQHHVEFVIPTTCEQVVEVEVEYPS